ncbi:MAG: IPT/TIG domain-containing protein [Alphaproteobacteria bacterium]|nr:IPT/TIG domain-containing protein [Alphaproteobacteria bacterium]
MTSVLIFIATLAACGSGAPELDPQTPTLFCEQADPIALTVQGDGLGAVVTDGLGEEPGLVLPTFRLEPAGGLAEGSAATTDRAVQVAEERVSWVDGRTLTLNIDEGLGLSNGSWDLVAVDPFGREGRQEDALLVAGRPILGDAEPSDLCHDAATDPVLLHGEDFLVLDGVYPSVTVAALSVDVLAASDCSPLAGGLAGEVCTTLELDLDPTSLPLGAVDVVVTNPPPMDCVEALPGQLRVRPPPSITEMFPEAVCRYGGTVQIRGDDFDPDAEVLVDGAPPVSWTWLDASTIEIEVGNMNPGLYDVTVTDPDGCTDTLTEALSVSEAPLIFYVDPPVVYGGVPVEVTAYIADITGEISDAWVVNTNTGEELEVAWSWDAASPSTLRAVIPSDAPVAYYELRFIQDGECQGDVGGTFRVRETAPVAIDEVDPPYAWTFDHTPVTIRATDPLPSGSDAFQETPRIYLVGPGNEATTTQVLGVSYQDAYTLTAVIPPGLDPGRYHVVAVNPDDNLGFLRRGLEVTLEGPPRIDALSPAALPNSGWQTVTIRGRDFRDPSVEIECMDNGTLQVEAGTVDSWGYARVQASLPASRFNRAVCILRLTNSDGTQAVYSALSITNPAQNLFPWQAGTDMVEARRGLAAVAGRVSSVDRYVYALGGDEGDVSSAKTSIEVARIGVYGDMEAWTLLPTELHRPRTLIDAVVVGRFIYVVGGNNGSRAVDGVVRAQILDPLDVPYFEDLTISRGGQEGLDAGRWQYRVSALFAEDDDINPDGESLPSEIVELQLPDLGVRMRPTLTWRPVDRAVGYRIYRTAEGGADLAWLTDVSDTRFTDRGGSTDATVVPIPEGGLGNWSSMAPLTTPREGACIAVGYDPQPDPERAWLYAAGGRDDDGNLLDSIEFLDITIYSPDEQEAGYWRAASQTLGEPRWQCAGYTVDTAFHTVVDDDESWVYFVGGLTDNAASGDAQAGLILGGGGLTDWQDINGLSPRRGGFAFASASNFLYAFGGHNGEPSVTGVSGELTSSTTPDVRNWNSLSTAMNEARYLAGSTQESAVIFVLGGETDDDAATHSTDFTNF